MEPFNTQLYKDDIAKILELDLPWNQLTNKTILISGSTGLIGSVLVDVLMASQTGCQVIALCRNEQYGAQRFNKYLSNKYFKLLIHDVNHPFAEDCNPNYIFHLASCTHPIAYATRPIETIKTNIIGTNNMLELAKRVQGSRLVFASSVEIYGTNLDGQRSFSETSFGYINSNTLRAGYPESKRCGEALCQAYIKEYGIDVVIPRICRCFGPTMKIDDSKALSQFILNSIKGKDIELKSAGRQKFSYIYVADAVSAILTILFKGESGVAYNVSSKSCDISLKDLAEIIASLTKTKVTYSVPSEVEKAGFSKASIAVLDSSKLRALGWECKYELRESIERTINMLK